MGELKRIKEILDQNKHKGFVKRILEPEKFPTLELGNGRHASHMMAWSKVGDKFIVYPTVLYDGKKLQQYSPDIAIRHVLETGNFIEFDNPKDADWFSKRYKQVWNK